MSHWAAISDRRRKGINDKISTLSLGNVKMFSLDCLEKILSDLEFCVNNIGAGTHASRYNVSDFILICRNQARGLIPSNDPSIESVNTDVNNICHAIYAEPDYKYNHYLNAWRCFDTIIDFSPKSWQYSDISYYILDRIRGFYIDQLMIDMEQKAEGMVNNLNPVMLTAFSTDVSNELGIDISDAIPPAISKQLIKIIKRSLTKGEGKITNLRELDWQEERLDLYVNGVLSV